MTYDTYTKMYLYNYYIENGSFANLSKNAPAIYRKLLADKKENGDDKITLTRYLELKLLKHRKDTNLDSTYIRYLYDHYADHSTLTGVEISKGFESKLKETADELKLTIDEVKHMFDNNTLYPELITQVKNRLDIRTYNNLLTIMSLNMFIESRSKPHIKMELFHDFDDYNHLRKYEPTYATLLKSKIPQYAGSLTGNENTTIKVEGTKYYGVDLQLETIPTLLDDIIYTFKGYSPTANLTPALTFKIKKMLDTTGNLNRIGLDDLSLLEELDKLSLNLGFQSIKELLEKEGYKFTPIEAKHASIIPCFDDYELILDDYDKAQIQLDTYLVQNIQSMDLTQELNAIEAKLEDSVITILVYNYEGKRRLVHKLITKSNDLSFKDKNSLNLLASNLI